MNGPRSTLKFIILLLVVVLITTVGGQTGGEDPRPSRYLTWPEFVAEIVAKYKGKPLRRGIKSTPESRQAFRYLLKNNVLTAWGELKKFDGFRSPEEQEWATRYIDEVARIITSHE